MGKFLRISAKALVVMLVLLLLIAVGGELMDTNRSRREPLNVEVDDTENPFTVPNRHDRVRDWIEERLNRQ
jgi:hypothetical protein